MVHSDSAAIVVERARLQADQRWLSAGAALGVVLFTAWLASGEASPLVLAAWLLPTLAVLAARFAGGAALDKALSENPSAVDCLQQLGAAATGLASGAAGTLFLPLLEAPGRIALTVVACAGLCAAIVEIGHQGRPFRLQSACCIGQFALAWWRIGEPGTGLVAASLVGFAGLAALASTSVDRLGRRVLAASSENRQLADSLSVEHARAVAADRAKTDFIAAASHDLRQPAAALSLMTNLLREQATDPALSPLVHGLERSVHSMNDLLGQLLDLSRLDTGRIAVEPRFVDIDALLDELAGELAPQAAERGLTLQVRTCGCELNCDPVLVARMLRNLADNALRHTREGGIMLAADAGERFRLSVADTGAGIDAAHQQRIFEEHYQVGNDSRQRANGLGLGLSIVRRIAALHSVEIRLASSPGHGSRFTLDFGAARHRRSASRDAAAAGAADANKPAGSACPDQPDAEVREACPARPRFAGRKLLLVEDDDALALAFLAWFQAAGFDARHAVDGAEARRTLRSNEAFDVVVSDFRLPGEHDGLSVLGLAGHHHPGAFRVLVSGDVDPALAERARACGIPLLGKPVDPLDLQRLLSGALAPGPGARPGGLESDSALRAPAARGAFR